MEPVGRNLAPDYLRSKNLYTFQNSSLILTYQNDIGSRLKGCSCPFGHAPLLFDSTHFKVIGYDQALKAHFFSEKLYKNLIGKSSGQPWLNRLIYCMRCHDAGNTCRYGLSERWKIDLFHLLVIQFDSWEMMMRVQRCLPQTREVLDYGHHPIFLKCFNDYLTKHCNFCWIVAEGSSGQMPFRLAPTHIHYRCQVHVEAYQIHFPGGNFTELPRPIHWLRVRSNDLIARKTAKRLP